MKLEPQHFGQVVVIKVLEPRIDAAIAIQFKEKVRELAAGDAGRVVLDMKAVEFLDSSGLGAIVAAMKQLGESRKLELASLSHTVDKVFRLTRMDTVFKIPAEAGDALDGLQHAS